MPTLPDMLFMPISAYDSAEWGVFYSRRFSAISACFYHFMANRAFSTYSRAERFLLCIFNKPSTGYYPFFWNRMILTRHFFCGRMTLQGEMSAPSDTHKSLSSGSPKGRTTESEPEAKLISTATAMKMRERLCATAQDTPDRQCQQQERGG